MRSGSSHAVCCLKAAICALAGVLVFHCGTASAESAGPAGQFLQSIQGQLVGAQRKHLNARLQDVMTKIRERINECWVPPEGTRKQPRPRIIVHVELTIDGELQGPPRVVSKGRGRMFNAAAKAVVDAIVNCAPFKNLPPDLYDTSLGWSLLELEFHGGRD